MSEPINQSEQFCIRNAFGKVFCNDQYKIMTWTDFFSPPCIRTNLKQVRVYCGVRVLQNVTYEYIFESRIFTYVLKHIVLNSMNSKPVEKAQLSLLEHHIQTYIFS